MLALSSDESLPCTSFMQEMCVAEACMFKKQVAACCCYEGWALVPCSCMTSMCQLCDTSRLCTAAWQDKYYGVRLKVPGRIARAAAVAELGGVRYLVGKQMYDVLTCKGNLQKYCGRLGRGVLLAWQFGGFLCIQI